MPTALVTGANRGIGLEFVRQYAGDGWHVVAAVRDPGTATELRRLSGDIAIEPLDVCDSKAVAQLAQRLRGAALDLLINNAGIYGPSSPRLGAIDDQAWHRVLDTDTIGPMRVTEALLDNLRAGQQKKIVAITSRMGSIADNSSGGSYYYRSAKAALNAVMKSLAVDLKPAGFGVAVVHPGWVKTAMGGPGAMIDPETSVTGMRQVIAALTPANSGRFLNYDGKEIPW